MRVHDTEPSAPAKPAPDRKRFQQALQQTGGHPPARASQPPGTPRKPAGAPPPTAPKPARASAPAAPRPGASLHPAPTAVATAKAVVQTRSALATPESLGHARQGMHVEAQRLHHTRTEAQSVARERVEHRVTEQIARELARDFRTEPAPAAPRAAPAPASESARASSDSGTPSGEPRVGGVASGTAPAEAPDAQFKTEAALALIERIEVFVKSQRPALRMSLGGALDATVEVERTGPREVALRIQGRRGPVPPQELARIREALEAKGLRLRALQAG